MADAGQRFTQSMACCSDSVCNSQKPAISSLVSLNGPSTTVHWPPANLTRAPLLLGCRPSPPSIAPASASSSLYWPRAVSTASLGFSPASLRGGLDHHDKTHIESSRLKA